MSTITIVSCFYIIPENKKRRLEDYCYWLSLFLNYIPYPIVFFSDGAIADTIDSLKQTSQPNAPWICIRRPLESLEFQGLEWDTYWSDCCKKGTNGKVNSPNVYRIWANKLILLEEVSKKNPFHTSHFYWCDAACWRNEEFASVIGRNWKLPLTPGFHCTWLDNLHTFQSSEEILLQGNMPTIAGAIFGGTSETIELVKKRFCLMYEAARRHSLLDLNDQGVLAASVFNMPNIHNWEAKKYPVIPYGDPWFLFQYLYVVTEI